MTTPRPVLVVDFGAQYAQLIARRVREARRLLRDRAALDAGRRDAGPRPGRDHPVRRPVQRLRAGRAAGRPGACSTPACRCSASATASRRWPRRSAATVAHTGRREFGGTPLTVSADGGALLRRACRQTQTVWMSHGDCVTAAPAGFTVTASSRPAPRSPRSRTSRAAGPACSSTPRSAHTEHGQAVLERFLLRHRRHRADLDRRPTSSTSRSPRSARRSATSEVICGLSGGVDSAVAAALVHRAVGDQLTCVFVDHGLLRAGEAEQVEKDYVAATGIKLKVVDAADRFLAALAGVTDPEQKRKIIGREFIRVFEAAAREIDAERRRRVPGAGHALPGRGRVRRRHRHREHQVPPQRRRPARRPAVRSWSSRCARCSRTRSARSAPSSACPRRWSGGTRSRARAWRSGSSARSPGTGWTCCARPTRSPARS